MRVFKFEEKKSVFWAIPRSHSLHIIPLIVKVAKANLTRNATRRNNRDDFLDLSFTIKISIFTEAYIKTIKASIMKLL